MTTATTSDHEPTQQQSVPAAQAEPLRAPTTLDLSPAACGAKLAELFPALFKAPDAPGPVKPIKLKIHADILARAPGVFSKRVLGIFFSRYTTSNAYLKALVAPDAQRFDLDGQPAGEIAEEHRNAAAEELERRRALAIERSLAQRKAAMPIVADTSSPSATREERDAPRRPRPPREVRNERRPESARPAPRAQRPPRPEPRPRSVPRPAPQDREPPVAAWPTDPAQRERALLLRAFESSPLSKANFCALKRISEAELDAALAQARQERGERKG